MSNKKCVAYMRYSTENQNDGYSIEYQRDAIKRYCQQNGLTLMEEFVDEAYSGGTDKRPAFQRMIAESDSKPDWNTILVYDHSRFFRNKDYAWLYKRALSDSGIKVVSVTEPFGSTVEGRFMEGFKDLVNDFFREDSVKRTHAGMSVKAKTACHCGGIAPLGYDVGDDGKLIVNEAEADTVREIFRLYASGYSYRNMTEYFNKKGIQTKAGKPFTKNSFYHILTQEKYIGTYRWNKRKAKNSKGKRNNHASKPLEEQTIIPDGCPAIVPLELFQTVQERLAERSNGRSDTKSRHHYVLGGMKLMRCAKCGSYMTGKVTRSHGSEYITYTCPNHKGGHCPTKDIKARDLDRYAVMLVTNTVLKKSRLEEINQMVSNGCKEPQVNRLRNQLAGIEKRIGNITRAIAVGHSDALVATLHSLEAEKNTVLEQLQSQDMAMPKMTSENLLAAKKAMVKYLLTSEDPEARDLLRTYVQGIRVSNDEVTIQLAG